MNDVLRLGLAVGLFMAGVAASGQEPLSRIVERGYVAHWLVCGPFLPDVDGGIVGALRRGDAVLGATDFMEPLGGIATLRPQHLNQIATATGPAIWQRAGASAPSLDLGPFFPDAAEGIAYAGFYATADVETRVLVELQTHLGARVFLNGNMLRDAGPSSFPAGGVHVFPATFPAGTSFFVVQVPGASHAALGTFLGTTESVVKSRHLADRPLLHGVSGYEIALAVQPMELLGDLAYTPVLTLTGNHTRDEAGIHPLGAITAFNEGAHTSQPVQLVARAGQAVTSTVVPPIGPGQARRIEIAVPGSGSRQVSLELSAGDLATRFVASIETQPPPAAGTVHVIAGAYTEEPASAEARTHLQAYRAALRTHLRLLEEPDYGFDLGPGMLWAAELRTNAVARPVLRDALIGLRTAPHLEWGPVDERLVGDETLARNLAYGRLGSSGLLETAGEVYYAWRTPAIAPQTPQLARSAGALGLVSSVETGGLPSIFSHLALDGLGVPHRRLHPVPGPSTLDELRAMAATHAQELAAMGVMSDVLVTELGPRGPEPYMLGASRGLANAVPSIRLSSAGVHRFMQDIRQATTRGTIDLASQAVLANRVRLGELIAQPSLKTAYVETEVLVLLAERTATAASLLGAAYPARSLDLAWRQLIAMAAPDRLGYADSEVAVTELLAGCHEVAAIARDVLTKSLSYIAGEVDTYRAAPLRDEQVRAVVVFNPSPWPRTDVGLVHVEGLGARGFSLMDDARGAVPCEITRESAPPGAPERLTGRFVARDVPGFGWRTYYLVPQASTVGAIQSDAAQIENESMWVTVEPESGGAIASVVEKRSGNEYVAGLWNDLVMLAEDPSRSSKDLWTTGTVERASARPARIEVTKHAAVQTIRVESAFGGGSIVRTLRVYPGVARIDAELELRSLELNARMIALSADVDPGGRVPVVGERFGAVVGRLSAGSLDFQSADASNHSASGLQPALRWAALAPGDSVVSGLNAAAPFAMVSLVVDAAGTMMDAARALQIALTRRGIPTGIVSDVFPERDGRWTDSTTFASHNEDARQNCGMRIILGGPDQNVMAKRVLIQAPNSAMAAFNARLGTGVSMYIEDAYAEGAAPVPTLIIGGSSAASVAQEAQRLAADLQERGHYQVPRDVFATRASQPPGETGVAMLFPGAFLFSAESDGSMIVPLAHRTEEGQPQTHAYRYAYYPFAGHWHDAPIAREAQAIAEPFQTVVTDLHSGRQRSAAGLFEVNAPSTVVTAICPVQSPEAAYSSREVRPVNGTAIRIAGVSGRTQMVEIVAPAPLRNAYESDVAGRRGAPVETDVNRAVVTVAPFEIKNVALEVSSRMPHGPRTTLESEILEWGPHLTTYWRHNRWNPTSGPMPVGIGMDGTPDEPENTLRLHIVNNDTEVPAQGTVRLSAPQDWHMSASSIPFDLPPRGATVEALTVLRKNPTTPSGGVVATVETGGIVYYDVLQMDPEPAAVDIEVHERRIEVLVRNAGTLEAMCRLEAVTAPRFWAELQSNPTGGVVPRIHVATIPPGGQQRFIFRMDGLPAGEPVRVKASINGAVHYHTAAAR